MNDILNYETFCDLVDLSNAILNHYRKNKIEPDDMHIDRVEFIKRYLMNLEMNKERKMEILLHLSAFGSVEFIQMMKGTI